MALFVDVVVEVVVVIEVEEVVVAVVVVLVVLVVLVVVVVIPKNCCASKIMASTMITTGLMSDSYSSVSI